MGTAILIESTLTPENPLAEMMTENNETNIGHK